MSIYDHDSPSKDRLFNVQLTLNTEFDSMFRYAIMCLIRLYFILFVVSL